MIVLLAPTTTALECVAKAALVGAGCVVIVAGILVATITICAVLEDSCKQNVYFLLVFAASSDTNVKHVTLLMYW